MATEFFGCVLPQYHVYCDTQECEAKKTGKCPSANCNTGLEWKKLKVVDCDFHKAQMEAQLRAMFEQPAALQLVPRRQQDDQKNVA